MQVTPEMTTEAGGRLDKLADFLDVDETGVQAVLTDHGRVKLTVGSTEYPCKSAYLDADDTLGVAWLLIRRAVEAKGGDFELLSRAWLAARRRAADIEETRDLGETFVMNLVNAFREIDAAIGIKP